MHFTKLHGLGNDYLFLDCTAAMPADPAELARKMSRRHFGVGSDGLICVCPSERADLRMRMFNADGSEGEMCGNGIRCLAKFARDKGLAPTDRPLVIETAAGLRRLEFTGREGPADLFRVDMGIPEVCSPRTLDTALGPVRAVPVSMGNPHAVVFVEDPGALDLPRLGPALERHPAFPRRTNVEFVAVDAPDRLRMRVWERGSGETLACGTGACAALAAAVRLGLARREVQAELPGGRLCLTWPADGASVLLTGPAVTVFEGEFPL